MVVKRARDGSLVLRPRAQGGGLSGVFGEAGQKLVLECFSVIWVFYCDLQ